MFKSTIIKISIIAGLCVTPAAECMRRGTQPWPQVNYDVGRAIQIEGRIGVLLSSLFVNPGSSGKVGLMRGAAVGAVLFVLYPFLIHKANDKQDQRMHNNDPVETKTEIAAQTIQRGLWGGLIGCLFGGVTIFINELTKFIGGRELNRSPGIPEFVKLTTLIGAGAGILTAGKLLKNRWDMQKVVAERAKQAKEAQERRVYPINNEINREKLALSNRKCGEEYTLYDKWCKSRCSRCTGHDRYCGKHIKYADEYVYSDQVYEHDRNALNAMKTELARLQREEDRTIDIDQQRQAKRRLE